MSAPATSNDPFSSTYIHHLPHMHSALAEAEGALATDEVPVGCIIVRRSDNRVIARGRNQTNATKNGTRHCEFVALEEMANSSEPEIRECDLKGCTLYVTIEPCIMCAAALRLVSIGLVVYGSGNERFGGTGSTLNLHQCPCIQDVRDGSKIEIMDLSSNVATSVASSSTSTSASSPSTSAASSQLPPLQGLPYPVINGILAAESIDILKRFYARGNQNVPLEKRHRKGVVAAAASAASSSTSSAASVMNEG